MEATPGHLLVAAAEHETVRARRMANCGSRAEMTRPLEEIEFSSSNKVPKVMNPARALGLPLARVISHSAAGYMLETPSIRRYSFSYDTRFIGFRA